jgi:hypothetical protein
VTAAVTLRPPSAADILALWERGQGLSAPARALLLLGYARPQWSAAQLRAATVGQCDVALLELHARTFGPRMDVVGRCPKCGAMLEFACDTRALALPPCPTAGPDAAAAQHETGAHGLRVAFRLPTMGDLLALAGGQGAKDGAAADDEGESGERPATRGDLALISRCVVDVRDENGNPLPATALPAEAEAALAERIAELDPGADMTFAVSCIDCGAPWQPALDMGGFLWRELSALARRLLHEVHVLASRYGWTEREILSLGARRRQAYLEGAWA